MNNSLLGVVANIAAAIGILVCTVSGIGRVLGSYHLLGFQSMTLFMGGIAFMVLAALIKVHRIEGMLSARQ